MTALRSLTHTVEAYNVSHASENKIHDDAVAKKLGFTGGLVPGVEVFAYATNPAVQRWGRAWLERGRMEMKFQKPVYDGRMATASGIETGADTLELKVESEGELCGIGSASLPAVSGELPDVARYQIATPPVLADRPPASEESLPEGKWLGIAPAVLTKERLAEYLRDARETLPIYAEHGIAHHGLLLRMCNSLLRDNVLLSPWIHVGSVVQNFGMGRVGEALSARGRVVKNYDRKGHRLVDLDCVLTADGRPIAHVLHTAIYRLRHLAVA